MIWIWEKIKISYLSTTIHIKWTRGQWPYIPASTRTMRNRQVVLNYPSILPQYITLITLVSMCILPLMASEVMAASKRPQRSCDLRFEIRNPDYPGIHVHIAYNGLRGHGGLQMTSEFIWPQIWHQQPWLPWYPCAYYLQWPSRPWWPPNDLGGHMTSDLTSATLITLVSMCILPPMASEAMTASEALITLVFMCILPLMASEVMEAFGSQRDMGT